MPVDWTSVEAQADGHGRALLDRLRVLAALADVHRDELDGVERAAQPGRWGHLKLVEPIGRGAFGQVYRARDTRLDRDVALKLLPAHSGGETRASSIIEEGRLLAQVRHPNVVTIHGAERIGGQIGLWMELVKGRTLEQILEQGNRFTASEAVEIGIQLCGAIAAVHDAGLLHRDIKSQNVMLSDEGRLVLMDFGTGRELGDHSAAGLAGTPLYLAPEILSGQEPTARSDIYSVGVLLYHLLTGSYPVRAPGLRDLRRAHERRERTDVGTARPGVAPNFARIIERAIEPAPERRYQCVDALLTDLKALTPPARSARRLYASGIAAAILLVITIAWETGGRLASVNPTPVIAVLPFEDLSTEPHDNDLLDGLADEIIRSLASVQGLQVRSRMSSFVFKDQPRNLRKVGEQLGANLVLDGSYQRSGSRLRIDARLVPVAGGVPVWAEQYDRELNDMFAVQDEISRAIVNKLRLAVGAGQRLYDYNIDTYILYLKARARLGRRGADDARAAAELFRQVVEKDREFAPAYAGLAEAYGLEAFQTLSPGTVEAALPRMEQAAGKALALDGLLAEGHAAMGFVHARRYDWANADKSFREALKLNSTLTQTYINYSTTTLVPQGRLDEAERLLNEAVRSDPLSGIVHFELGALKLITERYDEAIDHYRRALKEDPKLTYINQHLGRALTFAGRSSEALSFWETKLDPSGEVRYKESLGTQPWMAAAYVMAGRRAQVEQWAAVHVEPYRLALIHAALGNKDRTFEHLDKAADSVPHRVVALLSYPEMRGLRGDPRLADLRKKLHLQ